MDSSNTTEEGHIRGQLVKFVTDSKLLTKRDQFRPVLIRYEAIECKVLIIEGFQNGRDNSSVDSMS